MVNSLIFKDKIDLDLDYVNDVIRDLEIILDRNNIRSDLRFKQWLSDFQNIYGNKDTNIRLYICNSIIFFVGLLFISKFILGERKKFTKNSSLLENLKEFEIKIESIFQDLDIIEFEYFTPLYSISEKENLTLLNDLILKISDTLFKHSEVNSPYSKAQLG